MSVDTEGYICEYTGFDYCPILAPAKFRNWSFSGIDYCEFACPIGPKNSDQKGDNIG